MKKLATIIVILLITHTLAFVKGFRKGNQKRENDIELAFDAAAQQYKTDYENDTSRYDHYGNEKFSKRENQFVLPQNARTKGASTKAERNSAKDRTRRKRTF